MKYMQILIISLCMLLGSTASLANNKSQPNLKSILKTHNKNLLTPTDIAKGLPPLTQTQFPLSWKQTHDGMIKQELTYTYHLLSIDGQKAFIEITTSLDPIPVKIMLENGIEHQEIGNTYEAIGHTRCTLTLGACQYESLGVTKIAKTVFKKGIWITKLDKATVESVYDKNGLLLYRRHTTTDGFETTTGRIEKQ